MWGWCRRAIYAIRKQKPSNFTTNTLKAYLSSLSAFVISKTHITGQKPRGRQLSTKVCGSKSAIFRVLSLLLKVESPAYVTSYVPIQIYLQRGVRTCAKMHGSCMKNLNRYRYQILLFMCMCIHCSICQVPHTTHFS